jgi:hypothetical protein
VAHEPRTSADIFGPDDWWICTDQLSKGGKKVLGPFCSRALALQVRTLLEKDRKPLTYWVDAEA